MYAFDYQRPTSRDAAKAAAAGADARFLAGGQSLIQAMRLRLSQSERLVDLGGDRRPDRRSRPTATASRSARWRRTPRSPPTPTCKRADPGARRARRRHRRPRWCATWARSAARSPTPTRRPCYPAARARPRRDDPHRPAHDRRRRLLHGLYETALQPGELITAVALPDGAEGGLREVQAAGVALRAGRRVRRPDRRAACGSRVTGAKAPRVSRHARSRRRWRKSFTPEAAKAVKMPTDRLNTDLHGSAEYRAAMISVIASRAVGARRWRAEFALVILAERRISRTARSLRSVQDDAGENAS